MEKLELDLLDKMNYAACANFFTFGKGTNRIELKEFKDNVDHRGLLMMASIAAYYFNYKIYVDASYMVIKELQKSYKSCRLHKLYRNRTDIPTCDEMINHIYKAFSGYGQEVRFGDNL